ncbi:MAG TPA: hypothetical protein VG722_09920 [Tepidisphaeraceae bacterium]|nr:hypothetical protein [Tepidisphaeraceae bacterium]
MTPSLLLVLLLEATFAAVVWQALMRWRRSLSLSTLARKWDMGFQFRDHFGLAAQAAEHLDIPGIARLRATDTIFQQQGGSFFCAFTVSFTCGAFCRKGRHHRVAGVWQTGDRDLWIVAPADANTTDQYEFVRQRLMPKTKSLAE